MRVGIEYADGHYVLDTFKEIPLTYPHADIPDSVWGLYQAYRHCEREWQKYIRELDNRWHREHE